MYCPKCGEKRKSDDKFCISCGEELELYKNRENLQDSSVKSDPNYENKVLNKDIKYDYSEESVENNEIQLASPERRIGAYLIDMIILFFIIAFIGAALLIYHTYYITYPSSAYTGSYDLFVDLLYILVIFGYFFILEGPLCNGQTIGKMALHLRVVKEKDQSKIGYGKSFGRNILRLIDILPFLYIIGIILIAVTDLNQRLGDKAAHTIVIKE